MAESPRVPPDGKADDEVIATLARATSQVAADIHDEVEAARRAPRRQTWKTVVSGLLSLGALVGWLAFPPRRDERDPRSPARVERDLKLEIASLAQQVEDYRAARGGALPASLDEAGASSEVVQYRTLGLDAFELRGASGTVSASYESTEPLDRFAARLTLDVARP